MGFLDGKKALVVGVANERSLAWAVAKALKAEGAELGLTYPNEKMEKRVRPLAEQLGATLIEPLEASNDENINVFFDVLEKKWGTLDILIHSIAFANREDLDNRFIKTSREGFRTALEISAYSLIPMCRRAEPLMKNGGSVVTMSYYGAEKVVPNYNIMGVAKAALEATTRYLAWDMGSSKIRVNAISAGPVKTLAAAGVKNFRSMLSEATEKTPLKENINAEDVGALSAFLCGPGGVHITGSTLYVDSGAHIMA